MQLSPHKIETMLVRYFVSKITRINICVYFIVTIPRSNPKGEATDTKPLSITIFRISLPSNLPTGRDPRVPPINRSPDLSIELPIARVIPGPIEFPDEETKTRPTKPNPSLSRFLVRTPSCSHDILIDITREIQIS